MQAQTWRKYLPCQQGAGAGPHGPGESPAILTAFLSKIAPCWETVNADEGQCSAIAMAGVKRDQRRQMGTTSECV
jgi:hypothetical protein